MSGHLVHGMGTALEAPTWPAITAPEAAAVLAWFPDAGRFAKVSWHSPRPFSAAAMVETDRGAFVLKRHHPALRPPAALDEEHAFMAHLREAGLPVPQVLRAQDGSGAICHGAWTYELHRKADGLDLYGERPSWTPFLTHDHAHAAGQALARLHDAAQGYEGPERQPHPLIASFTILPAADPLAAAEAYVRARPALARFLDGKPWRKELARIFAAHGAGLHQRLADQPRLWTHNDWHPSNLLWSAQGRVRTIFDFGLCAPTCALHDLATAIERTAIAWLDLSDGPSARSGECQGDADAAMRLIAGYRSVRALSVAQVETVLRLLPLVHVEFALSEVDYFAGILNDREQAELAWQGYAIDHADWFLSAAGKVFLDLLRRGSLG